MLIFVKYHTVAAFEKHLAQAAPNHLAKNYLVVVSCPFERRLFVDKIVSYFPNADFKICASYPEAMATLQTPSLFGQLPAVFLDGIDQIKEKKNLEIARLSPGILLLGASGMKGVFDLYQKGKKELVVLDLSEEKPWERRRRIGEWIVERGRLEGKVISFALAEMIIDMIGLEVASLLNETLKLFCFVGERKEITKEDVLAICSTRDLATGWALAEAVILENRGIGREKSGDLNFLLPFMGQLRYQLHQILQIAEQLEHHKEVYCPPQMRPQTFEKYLAAARHKKSLYFSEKLRGLYELERQLKSTNIDPSLLFDRFIYL